MFSAADFYDISGQIARARQINKLVIDLHRKDIDDDFHPIGQKWLIGGGDPQKGGNEEWFYLCQAFWNYDDSYGELTDRIRPWFSPLKGYGPFTPFFAALALVRNQSALTPALIAYFEDFVLRTMPINMEEGDFIAVNDNTPSMIAAGLILAGEYFGKPEWIAKGKERIGQLRDMLARRGFLSEYNSLTYIPLSLYGMAAIVNYVKDEEAVQMALAQEIRIWKTTLAFYHHSTCQNAGPYARAYNRDKLAKTYQLRCLMYALLGDKCGVSPINTIFADTLTAKDYDDNYYWHICNAFVANMVYHCPKTMVEEFFARSYPYIVRGTAETSASSDAHLLPPLPGFISNEANLQRDPFRELKAQADCYEYPAGVIDIYSYIHKRFSMGTATRDWHNGVQSDGFTVLYADRDHATDQKQIGTVFANYTLNGSSPLDGDLGRKVAFQHNTTAMVLYHPKYMVKELEEACLNIVFGNRGLIDRVLIDGTPVPVPDIDGETFFESRALKPVFVETAGLYMMFLPLIAPEDQPEASMELRTHNGCVSIRLYNYRGPARPWQRKEACMLTNGFVCELRPAGEFESLEAFAHAFSSFTLTQNRRANIHTRYAFERECFYRSAENELRCCYSPATDGIKYMSINGKSLPQVDFVMEYLGG